MNTLKVICEEEENGYLIKSPAVGVYSQIPREQQLLNIHTSCGCLTILGRKHTLYLPEKISGCVRRTTVSEHDSVGYESVLFFLEKMTAHAQTVQNSPEKNDKKKPDHKAILSPIDGIFYSRPTPDEPPYVTVGTKITKGQVLGLVEVMKTFNQIIYSGDHFPDTATIAVIHVQDGNEVKSQQVLFVIE